MERSAFSFLSENLHRQLIPLLSRFRAIEDLGAKARVMELMAHGDPDVKYQSLVATQRLMSHAWQ
jgi:hypothetical protein